MKTSWVLLLGVAAAGSLFAESGRDAWLRYAALDDAAARPYLASMPAVVSAFGDSPVIGTARQELLRGVRGMLGRTLRVEAGLPKESAIVIGTADAIRSGAAALAPALGSAALAEDAFRIRTVTVNGVRYTVIAGSNPRGALYGAFTWLRKIALREQVAQLDETQTPYAPVRWINHWDNPNGTIERGYGGPSIFWDRGAIRADLTRAGEYARLLASLGINACTINNVNTDPKTITEDLLKQEVRVAEAFRPWGVRVAFSVAFDSPRTIGGLDTFDPLDERVIAFWKNKVDEIYRYIPDLAGFVLKADSEGQRGPSAYKRTHADAAHVIAQPLKAHGGLFFYRGFVYDNRMDWRNLKNDRARAAWDNFHTLDGKFDDNVIIQVKNGPIDFQVREPASPLFGDLEKTNVAIELQITQEYFGQSRHMVYLGTYWKNTLDFDMMAKGAGTPVKALVAGKVFHQPNSGFVGVSNVGMDDNWFNNHFSQANLYAFGRLAWNADLSARQIAEEWTKLTFGTDPKLVNTIVDMQMTSWRAFENYSGVLGLQTLTEMTGTHYGPAVEASERNGWGQWHRSDEKGLGMDRTVATGTGFIGQYRPGVAKMFESLETCPDDLLVFLHHVPYTHKLHSGKTVIQYIYDAHYEGAQTAAGWVRQWKSLAGLVDERRYQEALATLEYQADHAIVWRDSVNSWYRKTSGIPDEKGRVGKYPNRFEVESMKLDGYAPTDARPWETASGAKAVACAGAECSAIYLFEGKPGWYSLHVQYFDLSGAASHYRLLVGKQVVDEWDADDQLPARKIDGAASKRRNLAGVALRPGDEIRVEGKPAGNERAPLDYIEVVPLPAPAAPAAKAAAAPAKK